MSPASLSRAPVAVAIAAIATIGFIPVSRAASAPDWVNRAVATDDPSWQPESGSLLLYIREELSYLPPGRTDPKGGASAERKAHVLERGVVRIRTEDARRAGYAVLKYNPDAERIISANAWVVGAADHKVTICRRRDFTDLVAVYNSFYWDQRRVLQLVTADKASPGDALAWEFEYESALPFNEWFNNLRPGIPVLRREYVVTPEPGETISYVTSDPQLLKPLPGPVPGSFQWNLVRQEAYPARLPAAFIPNPLSVAVRSDPASPGSLPTSWEAVSSMVAREIETRVDPTGVEVTTQVARTVSGQTGRWDRIRALCRSVQESITYLEITEDHDSLAGYRPHSPATVLRCRFGDCKDKATLLVSELRSIGETARVLLVNHGKPLATRQDWPDANFNHAIVVIKADGAEPDRWPKLATSDGGRWIVFDPTDQDVPLGVLPPGDGGGLGLVVAEKGGELVRLPVSDAKASWATFKAHIVLGKENVAQVRIAEDFQGNAAASRHAARRYRTTEQFRDLLNDIIHRANPLSRDLHWNDSWDEFGAHYRVDLDFLVPAFGHAMPNGMLRVSPDVFPSAFRAEPWTEKAEGTVFFSSDFVEDELALEIPSGYGVDELPDGTKRQGARFSGEVVFSSQGPQIMVRKKLSREAGFYGRAEYNELRTFYHEIQEAERASVLLSPLAPKS